MIRSTRERIVEESLRLFAERGYAATSVAEIESASGLSPGAGGLYRHFRSKYEVLAAAVNEHVARTRARLSATLIDARVTPTAPATPATPATAQAMPATAQATPATAPAMPATAQAMPATAQAIPGTAQAIPGTAPAIPGTAQAMPGTVPATPATAQAIPGTVPPGGPTAGTAGPPGCTPVGVEERLAELCRAGLAKVGEESELTRVFFRDLSQFPELVAVVRDGLFQPMFDALRAWFQAQPEYAGVRADWPAVCAVLGGAVVHFRLFHDTTAEPAVGAERDRFVATWVRLALGLLPAAGGCPPTPTAG